MTLRILFGLAATLFAAVGALVTFKPETLFSDNFSFFQFSLSILAVPLIVLGSVLVLFLVLLAVPGAMAAVREIIGWRELPLPDVGRAIKSHGFVALAVCLVALGAFAYEAARLSRNLYSFASDQMFPQYRSEVYARRALDVSIGNLSAARQGYRDYAERFKEVASAAAAADNATLIDRMLAIESTLVKRAAALDKVFGVNRTSYQLRATALNLHPWNSALHDELASAHRRVFAEYLPNLLADAKACAAAPHALADKVRLARGLVLLGYERTADAGVRGPDIKQLRERFCAFAGGLPSEQVAAIVDSVWQRKQVEKLLERTEPGKLRASRDELLANLRYVEEKWYGRRPGSAEQDGGGEAVQPVAEKVEPEQADDMLQPALPRMLEATGGGAKQAATKPGHE